MLFFWQFILLTTTKYVLVESLIPNLSVQKLDTKVIQRKRQDTLDLCRIFTAENERLEKLNTAKRSVDVKPNSRMKGNRRMKRDAELPNPSLNLEDIKRVESIVDKLYDDMELNGQSVAYRRRDLKDITNEKNAINITARRFDFAPAKLTGLESESTVLDKPIKHEEGTIKIPWLKKWKHGIIPYFIDSSTYDTQLSETIIKAFDYFEKTTCIRLQRLRERPTDKMSLQKVEWLYISNPHGIRQCVHSNENKKNSGVQIVIFGYDCLSQGEIVHEVMHILGFSHEHTRSDRDQYLTIMWDNIKPGYKKYFEIRSSFPLKLPYDYSSVLHYPPRAFSKNGQVTILTDTNVKIGQREGLSNIDIEKIGIIFGGECVERNRQYLLKTCPSVVKGKDESKRVTRKEIDEYFKQRIWPYGIVNYKIRDNLEFSAEERENIQTVIRHIEKETCIEFRTFSDDYNEKESKLEDSSMEINSSRERLTTYDGIVTSIEEKRVTVKYDIIPNNVSEIISQMSENEIKQNDITDNEEKDFRKSMNNQILNKLSIKSKQINANITKTIKEDEKKNTKSPARRHAAHNLVLVRSSKPGCQCPTPGRPNGVQDLEINADCFNSVNDLLHLFVHVLGLDHQHNMHDRDSFLHIVWSNLTAEIEEEMRQKLSPAAAVGFPYDYQSVMHYPWLQIKNGVTNIMYPIWNDGWAMGHWQGLSSTDVQKLNAIYSEQCAKREEFYAMNSKYK